MVIKNIFKKKTYFTVNIDEANSQEELLDKEKFKNDICNKPTIPDGMWVKCDKCGKILYKKDLEKNLMTCSECNKHFRISAQKRICSLLDEGTFREFDREMKSENPLEYLGYDNKVKEFIDKTSINEAVITGTGKVNGVETVIGAMDSFFMMGSMGSVVGEKITRAFERAIEKRLPIIIFTASGGARMQEGIFSLMQMAKVSAAISKHNQEGLLYITVLTDPTTGGVTASFAMLGDIILAEPGALIGFAGKRVIEQTIKQELPKEFQSAEFLLEKGFVDKIVDRKNMREVISDILSLHNQ